MYDFQTVLVAVSPVFFITLAGVLLRRLDWLNEQADQSLLRVTVNVLMPALIFDSILQNQSLKEIHTVLMAPAVGFGTVALGIGLALLLSRFSGLTERKAICTFAICVGVYNYAYVCLPLAKSLYSQGDTVGVLLAHNLGAEFAMWILALLLLQSAQTVGQWKRAINAPVVAIILAVATNYFGLERFIPAPVLLTLKMLAPCAIPIGLILVGATIADHLKEFHSHSGWRVISSSAALRLGLIPFCFLLIARYLPCSVELKRVIVLQSGMPAAVFPIIVSKHYGGDPSTAVRIAIGTSVASLLTMPLWIRFGMKFAGL